MEERAKTIDSYIGCRRVSRPATLFRADRPCRVASCMGGFVGGGVCAGPYADSEAVCVMGQMAVEI